MATKVLLFPKSQHHFLQLFQSRCSVRGSVFQLSRHLCVSPSKTQITDNDGAEAEETVDIRDISRLHKRLRNQMSHVLRAPQPEELDWHPSWEKISFRRRLYAKYGRSSGNSEQSVIDKIWYTHRAEF